MLLKLVDTTYGNQFKQHIQSEWEYLSLDAFNLKSKEKKEQQKYVKYQSL